MLTFISGWKSTDRDKALLNKRDPLRRAIFFLENSTSFLDLLPNAPLIELYRTGRLDFKIGDEPDTLVRVNYDTEHDLVTNAVTHVLLNGADAQIIVTFDALDRLYRLVPALRASGALLAPNERLEAFPRSKVRFSLARPSHSPPHPLASPTLPPSPPTI